MVGYTVNMSALGKSPLSLVVSQMWWATLSIGVLLVSHLYVDHLAILDSIIDGVISRQKKNLRFHRLWGQSYKEFTGLV